MTAIRLPRMFIEDHHDRGLQTPRIIKVTRRHVWIDPDDPAVPELLSDARYYADSFGFDPSYRGLCASARATLSALEPPTL